MIQLTRNQMAFDEATSNPIFLFQRSRIIYFHSAMQSEGYEYDGDRECIVDTNIEPPKEPDRGQYDNDAGAKYEYDLERFETVIRPEWLDSTVVEDEKLLDQELATRVWETELVFYSREESDAYGERRHYNYPGPKGVGWRTYSVPCQGTLADVLNAHDDSRVRKPIQSSLFGAF